MKTTFGQVFLAIALPSLALSSPDNKNIHPELHRSIGIEKAGKQQILVSGRVTDSKGQGLPGVSVLEKGTKNAASTDADGNFKISVSAENSTLVFSFIGFDSQEISLNGKTALTVNLNESVNELTEVVVVGYGTQKKRDLTGSVASVQMKELASLPVPDIGQAMQGRAAGVQVVSSGDPGSNVAIRIRGTSTIGNSNPLLVIDGVPTDVPLNTISPDDIASMDILKDASASAIYGSRAASGVVLITTKRGSAGKGKLEFKAFTGVKKATGMVDMLNSAQYAELHNEMMLNSANPQNPAFADPSSLTTTNWLDEMFRNASLQNYSLAYSGGSEKSTYYVSGTVLNEDGIVVHNNYKRYTVQFNGDARPLDWLKVSNNLTLNHDVKSRGSINIRNAMAALPTQAVYNADGTFAGPEGQSLWYGDIRNPVGEALLNDNKTSGYNVLGNINGEITILPYLKFKTTLGIQTSFWDERNWSPKYNWKPIVQPYSSLSQTSNRSNTYLFDNFLTYDTNFKEKHYLTVLAGASAQNNRFERISASKQNFISDGAQQLDNGSLLPTAGGNASEWALFSLLARANYSYADKYLVTASIRRDGSSRFGANYRYGIFPSGSVKWRLSEESFFKKNDVISDVAIRAGYGVTGNQEIGNYGYVAQLKTGQYVFGDQIVSSVVPNKISNPNLRWEEVEQSNLGVDASFLRGRINLTVDAYIKNTNDMLVPMSVPITTGFSDLEVPDINFGKVRNKGVELNLTTQNFRGTFDWSTNFNISYNTNEILGLNGDVPLFRDEVASQKINIQKVGYPINSFYGVITNGIFQTQEEVNNYAIQQQGSNPAKSTSIGDFKFLDINNDGKIDDDDRTYLGNPSPRFIFALNNSFSYKGFDLSIFLQGVEGNDIFNANNILQAGMAITQNQTTAVLDRWTPSNPNNSVPRAIFDDPNKNTRPSTRYIEDGSYLRLKNLTFGYTIPRTVLSRAKISNARVYLSGQNLFTLTNYSGFDPEVGANGIDNSVYPVSRTISAGINFNF